MKPHAADCCGLKPIWRGWSRIRPALVKRSGLDYGSATPTTPILNYVIYEHCELLAAYEKLNQSILGLALMDHEDQTIFN